MHILVQIDLSAADIALFEAYEARVLELLPAHGARLELRLRATDDRSETHLLYFPHAAALDAYRADPVRVAVQSLWDRSGAHSTLTEVARIG